MSLPPSPPTIADAAGAPLFGTYAGVPGDVDLSRVAAVRELGPRRLTREKRWSYHFVATPQLAACFAVVDVGYASTAFATAVHLGTGEVLLDEGAMGPFRPLVSVTPDFGPRHRTSLRTPRLRLHTSMHGPYLRARVRAARTRLDLSLATAGVTGLTVIAPVERGIVNVTHKRAAMPATGQLLVGRRRFSLDGGLGGVDFTVGLLARRTSWRWAFVCGRLGDGRPFGLNLVDGFNDSRPDVSENALWLDGLPRSVGRPTFRWNHDDPLDRWHVTTACGTVDLTLSPVFAHREERDLVLVRSRFIQPLGVWSGTLNIPESGRLAVEQAPGVAEDQRVIW